MLLHEHFGQKRMDDEVNGSHETAWGTEPVATGRMLFTLSGELAQVVEVDVPRIDADVVGDQSNSNNEHSHIV